MKAGPLTGTQSTWQRLPEVVAAQRRTLGILALAQILGGIGIGAGLSVGVLLAEQITTSEGWAGLARAGTTLGAALVSVPLASLALALGRRMALGGGWLIAATGSTLLLGAAQAGQGPLGTVLLMFGMLLSGTGSAVTLQSRYAGTDLAAPRRRSRDLSLVVWAGTIGSVLGPNLGTPGAHLARAIGLADFAGPFLIAAVMQTLAAGLFVFLRPDPLRLAAQHQTIPAGHAPRTGIRTSLKTAWAIAPARIALVTISCAHTVMVGVMTMTPVHMEHHGHGVTIIGLTISVHVLGMFALAPVFGWAADRYGRLPVIAAGLVVLLASTAIAGTAGGSAAPIMIGLTGIGLGWSLVMVAASALLTEAIEPALRTRVQGASDAVMNGGAWIGAALSGPLLGKIGFGGLNALAALLVAGAATALFLGHRAARSPQQASG